MEEIFIRDGEDFIKLGQAMKKAGLCMSGADAKNEITGGFVKVNGITELKRGKKLHDKDIFEYKGKSVIVKSIRK